jgi:hypothetical protein
MASSTRQESTDSSRRVNSSTSTIKSTAAASANSSINKSNGQVNNLIKQSTPNHQKIDYNNPATSGTQTVHSVKNRLISDLTRAIQLVKLKPFFFFN